MLWNISLYPGFGEKKAVEWFEEFIFDLLRFFYIKDVDRRMSSST